MSRRQTRVMPWRILAWDGPQQDQFAITAGPGEDRTHPELAFDEIVLGHPAWLHVEEQATGEWWLSCAGFVIVVSLRADDTVRLVRAYTPGSYDDPIPAAEVWLDDEPIATAGPAT